jgi:hypothetical protein
MVALPLHSAPRVIYLESRVQRGVTEVGLVGAFLFSICITSGWRLLSKLGYASDVWSDMVAFWQLYLGSSMGNSIDLAHKRNRLAGSQRRCSE